MANIAFFFEGGKAGCFDVANCPTAPGVFAYMPYRSGAHYAMYQALKKASCADCHYEINGHRVNFRVVGCPEYGKLDVQIIETKG